MATMSACFVTSKLADHLIDQQAGHYPYPKLLDWEAEGKQVYLTDQELAAANAGEGADLFFAYVWVQLGTQEERTKVRALLSRAWLDRHQGYKIKRVFISALDELIDEAETVGLLKWWEVDNGVGYRVAMLGVTAQDTEAMSNPFIAELFAYMPPQIRFSRAERELLRLAAVEGLSDLELASHLCVSPDAIKKRWNACFYRAHKQMPALFEGAKGYGSQRRAVLEYVQMNREELWPYQPPKPNAGS